MKQAIAYYRVSTARQGKSGLGLEAQQAMLARFAEQEGITISDAFARQRAGSTTIADGRS